MHKRQIAILGSTGSVGMQALEVIRRHSNRLTVYAMTANNQVEQLINQAREFRPEIAIITNEALYERLKEGLRDLPIKVWAGADAILQVVKAKPIDIVLAAIVGYAGLKPIIQAIRARKIIALANKETLVVAGELITKLAMEYKTSILPVDSEHSAIFQCLTGEQNNPPNKILLTASGGPFRAFDRKRLKYVTKNDALKHPNWNMGAKVTIDSASLMNKGFEMMEAKWLFGVTPEQIEIVVHPQSIIHSMVQFYDKSVKAQLGVPDMRLPIQYALTYPKRLESNFPSLDFHQFNTLTFEEPDTSRFRNLNLAYEAIRNGGNMPCILNAANETVVSAFLQDKIGFLEMSDIIEQVLPVVEYIASPTFDDLEVTDAETRNKTLELIN